MLHALGLNYAAMLDHKWMFDFSEDGGFDFDGVFEKYEAQSRIPDLFDKLVEILEQVVQCDELDKRSVVRTLETMIATLKKNRKGSYFGVIGTWNFVATYLKHCAWNTLAEIKVLKVLTTSLRQTLDDTNKAMAKLHEDMAGEFEKQLKVQLPALTYQALSLPDPPALVDDTIIEGEVVRIEKQAD